MGSSTLAAWEGAEKPYAPEPLGQGQKMLPGITTCSDSVVAMQSEVTDAHHDDPD